MPNKYYTSRLAHSHRIKRLLDQVCDLDKNLMQRRAKWRNFYQVSGGRMFVVSDNYSCMSNINSEINNS